MRQRSRKRAPFIKRLLRRRIRKPLPSRRGKARLKPHSLAARDGGRAALAAVNRLFAKLRAERDAWRKPGVDRCLCKSQAASLACRTVSPQSAAFFNWRRADWAQTGNWLAHGQSERPSRDR